MPSLTHRPTARLAALSLSLLTLALAGCGSGGPPSGISFDLPAPDAWLDPSLLPMPEADATGPLDVAATDADAVAGPELPPDQDAAGPDVPPDLDLPAPDDAAPDGDSGPDVEPEAELGPDVAPEIVEPDVPADAGPDSDAAEPDCSAPEHCDMSSLTPCQQAACVDGACVAVPAPAGTPCAAAGGAPPSGPCSESLCDDQGECVEIAVPAGACDDGDPCTAGETCGEDGACDGGLPVVCQPPGPCELALCDASAGGCVGIPATPGLPCEDGDPCTAATTCDAAGACSGGENLCLCETDLDCPDDGDLCNGDPICVDLPNGGKGCVVDPEAAVTCPQTKDPCFATSCDPASGACVTKTLPGKACSDEDPCTSGDTCDDSGACLGGPVDCADTNPCTEDACQAGVGVCIHLPLSGAPCQDGSACTTGDVCQQGMCAGKPKSCSDGNPCTADLCDPETGGCTASAASGGECDDGSACTEGDTCLFGVCVGKKVLCGDDSPCTADACDPASGCTHAPVDPGSSCDDGDFCTGPDVCAAGGVCVGAPIACDDPLACTVDACDPALGCTHTPDHAACDDGAACTTGECYAGVGCVQLPVEGACDDGEPCTVGDACSGGACAGKPADCNDGVPCTADSCVAGSGCQHLPDAAACDDGNACTADACHVGAGCVSVPLDDLPCEDGDPCTLEEMCVEGSCQPGANQCPCAADADCDDGNACNGVFACQADPEGLTECVQVAPTVVCAPAGEGAPACQAIACDPSDGQCKPLPVADATPCPDNDPCTVDEECFGGTCFSADLTCDDGLDCTVDACEAGVGCVTTPDDAACDDGVPCTLDDCSPIDGCRHVPDAHACDDQISCTTDGCDLTLGCTHQPDSSHCSDGVPCTADTCVAGSGCVHAPSDGDCDDDDACTDDSCDPAQGCVHAPSAPGPCDDGNPCTEGDSCDGGVCAGGPPKPCPPGVDCQSGACDPETGDCVYAALPDGTSCSDGDACTEPDECLDGGCASGGPASCDDGIACTADHCDPLGGCAYDPMNGPVDGACDDGNPCTVDTCTAGEGCAYAAVADFQGCDDGIAGTGPDVCVGGACRGMQPGVIDVGVPSWCDLTDAVARSVADLDGNFFAVLNYQQQGGLCAAGKSRVVRLDGTAASTVLNSDAAGVLTAIDHDLVLGDDGQVGRLVFGGSYVDFFLADVLVGLGQSGVGTGPWAGLWAARVPATAEDVEYYLVGQDAGDGEGRVVRCLRAPQSGLANDVDCEVLDDDLSGADWEDLEPRAVSGLMGADGALATAAVAGLAPNTSTLLVSKDDDSGYDAIDPPSGGILRDVAHLGDEHGVWVVGSGGRVYRRLGGSWSKASGVAGLQGLDVRAVSRVRDSLVVVGHQGGIARLFALPAGADPGDSAAWLGVTLGEARAAYDLHATDQALYVVGRATDLADEPRAFLWYLALE